MGLPLADSLTASEVGVTPHFYSRFVLDTLAPPFLLPGSAPLWGLPVDTIESSKRVTIKVYIVIAISSLEILAVLSCGFVFFFVRMSAEHAGHACAYSYAYSFYTIRLMSSFTLNACKF